MKRSYTPEQLDRARNKLRGTSQVHGEALIAACLERYPELAIPTPTMQPLRDAWNDNDAKFKPECRVPSLTDVDLIKWAANLYRAVNGLEHLPSPDKGSSESEWEDYAMHISVITGGVLGTVG